MYGYTLCIYAVNIKATLNLIIYILNLEVKANGFHITF